MSFSIGNYSTTHLIKTWHPADTPTMNGGVQRAAIALTSIANYLIQERRVAAESGMRPISTTLVHLPVPF